MDLSGVAFGRADAAGQIATGAIRTIHLLAQDGALAETKQHAAQSVGQVERGAGAVEGTIGVSSSKSP